MNAATALNELRDRLSPSDRMPVVFLGHGSPMHAIEDTEYSRAWTALGKALPRPQAIVVVSAHWMSRGSTLVDVSAMPRTIHDFRGFPAALYEMQYPAPGEPALAHEVADMLADQPAQEDDSWGLDHGAWCVLKFLYPDADLPVFQVSIDMDRDLGHQLEVGRALAGLRERGVLVLGSGNVVHNLRTMQPGGAPQDFAVAFDALFADRLAARDFAALADREELGSLLAMSHPTVDHYLPALTIAGASDARDELDFVVEGIDLGSMSMRSFVFHTA